jgi:hypothetical protein
LNQRVTFLFSGTFTKPRGYSTGRASQSDHRWHLIASSKAQVHGSIRVI